MQYILYPADLTSEYWSYTILPAIYIKNRPPHIGIKKTPFQALTGKKPDISNPRTFGSWLYAKKPGQRHAKLDNRSSNGILIHDTATTKNV